LRFDAHCARASIMVAEMALERGQPEQAIAALKQVEQQDSRLLPECLPLVKTAFEGDDEALLAHLIAWQEKYPSAAIELCVFEVMQKLQRQDAVDTLFQYVKRRPTLAGLRSLSQYQLERGSHAAVTEGQLPLLFQLVGDVMKTKSAY